MFFWTKHPEQLRQLNQLGPEPLTADWNPDYLMDACRNRNQAIKVHIMNQAVIVGIGNIYANETLFLSGIDPQTPAKAITSQQAKLIVQYSKAVLKSAITQGGTTLKDFMHGNGQKGYFQVKLFVYGRDQQPCRQCHTH